MRRCADMTCAQLLARFEERRKEASRARLSGINAPGIRALLTDDPIIPARSIDSDAQGRDPWSGGREQKENRAAGPERSSARSV
jgi:hypothetical protein